MRVAIVNLPNHYQEVLPLEVLPFFFLQCTVVILLFDVVIVNVCSIFFVFGFKSTITKHLFLSHS